MKRASQVKPDVIFSRENKSAHRRARAADRAMKSGCGKRPARAESPWPRRYRTLAEVDNRTRDMVVPLAAEYVSAQKRRRSSAHKKLAPRRRRNRAAYHKDFRTARCLLNPVLARWLSDPAIACAAARAMPSTRLATPAPSPERAAR